MQNVNRFLPSLKSCRNLNKVRPSVCYHRDLAPGAEPFYVGIIFGKLLLEKDRTLSLFEEDEEQERLAQAVQAVNQKHGRMVDIGGLYGAEGQVPLRIPFGAPEPRE